MAEAEALQVEPVAALDVAGVVGVIWPEVLRDDALRRLVERTCPGITPLPPAPPVNGA